MLGSVLIEVV